MKKVFLFLLHFTLILGQEFDLRERMKISEEIQNDWIPNLNSGTDGEDDEDFVLDLKFIENSIIRALQDGASPTGGDDCKVDHCKICNSDKETCQTCKDGYELSEGGKNINMYAHIGGFLGGLAYSSILIYKKNIQYHNNSLENQFYQESYPN